MEKEVKAQCDKCPLKDSIFVPSEINDTNVLVLAEAPGLSETKEGRPLVGVAGNDLMKIVSTLHKKREDLSYMNVVSCRPTRVEDGKTYNRTPTLDEIVCCNARMTNEIDKIQPQIIVCMGKTAYEALTKRRNSVMKEIVGSKFVWRGIYDVVVTYHPAAISYAGGNNTEIGRRITDIISKSLNYAFEFTPTPKQLRLF
jgi:DNA polymerase